MDRGLDDRFRGSCSCAERTGELVVFTCPVCMTTALEHLQALTRRGVFVKLDSTGSVSGLELELEALWPEE